MMDQKKCWKNVGSNISSRRNAVHRREKQSYPFPWIFLGKSLGAWLREVQVSRRTSDFWLEHLGR